MAHEPDWYTELAEALKSRKLEASRTSELVAEARAHCAETGEEPGVAFGKPDVYAAHLASTGDPDETRYRHTAERYADAAQPVAYRVVSAFGISIAGVGLGFWLVAGVWRTLTSTDVFGGLVVCAAICFSQLRSDARRAGHPLTARRIVIGGLIVFAVLLAFSGSLPMYEVVRVPTPALVVAGILVTIASAWLGHRWNRAHLPLLTHLSRDAWLDRLAGLLEGRYGLSAARARDFRAEAASHLAESGGTPEQEFGPVDDYAAELAEQSGLRKRQKRWPVWFSLAFFTLLFGLQAAYVVSQEGFLNVRSAILLIVTLLLAKALAMKVIRRYRTSSARRSTWARSSDQQ